MDSARQLAKRERADFNTLSEYIISYFSLQLTVLMQKKIRRGHAK